MEGFDFPIYLSNHSPNHQENANVIFRIKKIQLLGAGIPMLQKEGNRKTVRKALSGTI